MDKLKKISNQLYQLAVELESEIVSESKNLKLADENNRKAPSVDELVPFPDEDHDSQKVEIIGAVVDTTQELTEDPMTMKADEMAVEMGEVLCPKCLSGTWLRDNRRKRESAQEQLNGSTTHLTAEDLEKLEKKTNIPIFSCSQYMNDNGCGWATWDILNNPPLGSDRWTNTYLEDF